MVLIINNFVVVQRLKNSGHESVRDVAEHASLLVGVDLEESPECSENVVEQVIRKQLAFYRVWQQTQLRVVRVERLHFVESPEMSKIFFDLDLQRLREWLSIFKSLKRNQPPIQVFSSIYDADFSLIRADDFDEITDNVGEEGHSQKHDDHRKYHLNPTYGVVVSVAHSR